MNLVRAKAAGIGALTCLLVAAVALPSGASAATTTDPVAAAAGWLTTQFEDGTHLPVPAGDHFDSYFAPDYFASPGMNADVVFGLAAAKAGATKSGVALDYLAASIDDYADLSGAFGGPYDGSVAKAAVAAQVGGRSATAFGGHDLLQTLKDDECAPASMTCTPGSPTGIYSSVSASFVILAEARAGGAFSPSPEALTYFVSLQCANGGFTAGITACGAGAADVDATSYAIMALQATGGGNTQLANAVTWLTAQRGSDGSWASDNVNSTGLATAALAGQSVNVTTSKTWLLTQQVAAGSPGAGAFKYAGSFTPTALAAGTSTSVLATAQALTALGTDGSLATLTAAGSTATATLFAPSSAVASASVTAGAQQTVTANGFAAGETVNAVLNSAPLALAASIAGANGSVSLTFTVPPSLDPGAHTVTFTGASSGLTATTAAFTVLAAAATPAAVGAGNDLADTGLNGPVAVELTVLGALAVLAGAGLVFGGKRRRTG
jgi:hypothetical protein